MARCDMCDDPEGTLKDSAEMMKKYGWIVHFVTECDDYPYDVNIHTHGLAENFNHPDLQVVLNLDTQIVHDILCDTVVRIKAGERFEPGRTYERIVDNGLRVKFIEAEESGQKILRMIFPDENGRSDIEEIDEKFQRQYQ